MIVDYGSGNGRLEDVERLRHSFPELQALSEVRRGQAHSVTRGIDAAKWRLLDQGNEVTHRLPRRNGVGGVELVWTRADSESVDPPVLRVRWQANRMKSAYWSGIVVGNMVGAFRGGVI